MTKSNVRKLKLAAALYALVGLGMGILLVSLALVEIIKPCAVC